MRINDIKEKIDSVLYSDTSLLGLLAMNPDYITGVGSSKTNSIIPAGMATATTNTPFVIIQGGPSSRVDNLGHLYDDYFYIRCYNDRRKAYIDIYAILDRVEQLLNDSVLVLDNGINETCILLDTTPESYDEAMEMNYVECRYRVREI